MSNSVNLVSGRLGLAMPPNRTCSPIVDHEKYNTYGIYRLGLSCKTWKENSIDSVSTVTPPFKKCTFKLPRTLAQHLKYFAKSTNSYQYVLATEAIVRYLNRSPGPAEDAGPQTSVTERCDPIESCALPDGGKPQQAVTRLKAIIPNVVIILFRYLRRAAD